MAGDKHLERILRESGVENLLDVLVDRLPASDLSSLLMEVAVRRARKETPATLLSRFEKDPFARPSQINPLLQLEFDRVAFSLAEEEEFDPVEISPVAPLATVSALSNVSQKKVLATSRASEVVADATNVLALVAAVRRRSNRHQTVNLCASHRLVRVQPVSGPISFAHFRLFTLVSAGRDKGSFGFELGALANHIRFYLRLFQRLNAAEFRAGGLRVSIAVWNPIREEALRSLLSELQSEYPECGFGLDTAQEHGRTYYREAGFQIFVTVDGSESFLVDGGLVDWTQQLLNDRKERLMTSAIGSERFCALFPRPADS